MPEPFGLTVTGATVVEDTFIIGGIGLGQGQAVLTCEAAGRIPAVAILTTEAAGAGKIVCSGQYAVIFTANCPLITADYILSGTSMPNNFMALLIAFAVAADNCNLNCFTFSSSTFNIGVSW